MKDFFNTCIFDFKKVNNRKREEDYMELYDRLLSDNSFENKKNYKSVLKSEYRLLNKTMTGIIMTMGYGNSEYQKEVNDLEEKMDKINICLSLMNRKK